MAIKASSIPRCKVCGVKTKKTVLNTNIPICDNIVCHNTLIEEVNKEIKEITSSVEVTDENDIL